MPSALVAPIVGGLASGLVGGLLGGKSKSPAPPAAPPVLAMPDPGAMTDAKKRQLAAKKQQGMTFANATLLGSEDKLGA